MKSHRRAFMSMLAFLPVVSGGLSAQESESDTIVLDEFIVEETGAALNDTVMPTDREISGLFGEAVSVLEVPRSVTLLSPKIMDQFQIDDLRDLEKIGAGTQAINYYGVPGAPTIRGAKGGTYLNGMLRAFNRNEMPLSFGSLEAIEVVKGPAPADYTPTLIGGFVNLIPKSPFFDEEAGSIELQFDNWGKQKITADYGAPFLLGDVPAAYRVSLTSQDGESYYDGYENDFTSIYGAIKFRPTDGISVFIGGEYFDYQSNENAGWNRPTQQLIDSGAYVIGEPVDVTSAQWNGTADRALVNQYWTGPDSSLFIGNDSKGASYGTLAIDAAVFEAAVTDPALRAAMAQYDPDGDGVVNQYVYSPEYFAAGGTVLTQQIEGSDVLTDPNDFADSQNYVLFGDVVFDSNPDRTYTVKGIFEHLETEKLSSYGYALNSEQTVFGGKAFLTDKVWLPNTVTTLGLGLRYTDAKQLQDFWDEPFSRRDISTGLITGNSIVYAGPQRPVGGDNLWIGLDDGFGGPGGNIESELLQASLFATFITDWTERLKTIAAARYEYADFDVALPSEVEGESQAVRSAAAAGSGDTDYFNWSFGPSFEIVDGVSLYGTYQEGTSMDPLQGGPIAGEDNFTENEMWEVGIKTSLFENRLFASVAYYDWEQASFDTRAGLSEQLEGEGFEVEATWLPTDNLTIIASYTWQEVTRVDPLGFRTIPYSEEDWALHGGVLNSTFGPGSFDGRDRSVWGIPPNNTDLVYPGTPQTVIKLFALYEFDNGFYVSGGPIWQEEFYLNFDETIELPDALIWNLNFGYKGDKWEVGVAIDNLTDEDYFLGSDPTFAANTLVTKAPETTYTFSVKYKF